MLQVVLPESNIHCRSIVRREGSMALRLSIDELSVNDVTIDFDKSSITGLLVVLEVPLIARTILEVQDAVAVSFAFLVPFAFILISVFNRLLWLVGATGASLVVVPWECGQDITDLLHTHFDCLERLNLWHFLLRTARIEPFYGR